MLLAPSEMSWAALHLFLERGMWPVNEAALVPGASQMRLHGP